MATSSRSIEVPPEASGNRLDAFLARALPAVSRSAVTRWIREGRVTLPARRLATAVRPGTLLRDGDVVRVDVPERRGPAVHLVPEERALDIVYEDADLMVVNKPSGLTVHPGAGRATGTLVHALLGHTARLSAGSAAERPGIVHRLDKDTSGLLVVARTDEAHRALAAEIEGRRMRRTYHALVWGAPAPPEGRVEGAIGRDPRHRQRMAVRRAGGKPAATRYRTLEGGPVASLLEIDLETGRTHQIRVHLASIGHPVVGDPVYGGREKALARFAAHPARRAAGRAALAAMPRQALHARRLAFTHPRTGEALDFRAPYPADFESVLEALRAAPAGARA